MSFGVVKIGNNGYGFGSLTGGYIEVEVEHILTLIADYKVIKYGKEEEDISCLTEIQIFWKDIKYFNTYKESVEQELKKLEEKNNWKIGTQHFYPLTKLTML